MQNSPATFEPTDEVQRLVDYIKVTWRCPDTDVPFITKVLTAGFDEGWNKSPLDNRLDFSQMMSRRADFLHTLPDGKTLVESDKLYVFLTYLYTADQSRHFKDFHEESRRDKAAMVERARSISNTLVKEDTQYARIAPQGFHEYVGDDNERTVEPYMGDTDHLFTGRQYPLTASPNFQSGTSFYRVVKTYENEHKLPVYCLAAAAYQHGVSVRRDINTALLQKELQTLDLRQPYCGTFEKIMLPAEPMLVDLAQLAARYIVDAKQVIDKSQWKSLDTIVLEHPGQSFLALNDYQWEQSFRQNGHDQRVQTAMLWCAAFNAKTVCDRVWDKLTVAVEHYQWMRDAYDYVQHEELGENSPYRVLHQYVNNANTAIPPHMRAEIYDSVEKMWFGQPPERENALRSLAKVINKVQGQHSRLSRSMGLLMHSLAWDIVKNDKTNNPLLLDAAVRFTIIHGKYGYYLSFVDADPRAVAWYLLAQARNKRGDVVQAPRGMDVLNTVRQMHPVVATSALFQNVQRGKTNGKDSNDYIVPKVLWPVLTEKPTMYDVLRHWVPSRSGLWSSAQTLELHPTEAFKQLYSELKTPSGSTVTINNIPTDLA